MGKKIFQFFKAPVSGYEAQTVSIDLDGSTEHFKILADVPTGIANAWTIAQWVKPGADSFTNASCPMAIRNSGDNSNLIELKHIGNAVNDPYRAQCFTNAAGILKRWTWDNFFILYSSALKGFY